MFWLAVLATVLFLAPSVWLGKLKGCYKYMSKLQHVFCENCGTPLIIREIGKHIYYDTLTGERHERIHHEWRCPNMPFLNMLCSPEHTIFTDKYQDVDPGG